MAQSPSLTHRRSTGIGGPLDRRAMLRLFGFGGAAIALRPLIHGAELLARPLAQTGDVDIEIAMRAGATKAQLRPGPLTDVLHYTAEVVRGAPSRVQPLAFGADYLGPAIHLRAGERVRIHFTNGLDEPTTVHWHGLHVPPEADGHPADAVAPGATYTYAFEVRNLPATYWYHPHPHGRTGYQVHHGLAGLLIVDGDADAGLPSGARDMPLVIQDRVLDAGNRIVYSADEMTRRMGAIGDTILINGRAGEAIPVAPAPYRLRLLNGSNARTYKLGWSDGTPLSVIGVDGGLLEAPSPRPYVTLGVGQRIELLVDFGRWPVGSDVALRSLQFSEGAMPGMGPLPNGAPFQVLSFRITDDIVPTATSEIVPTAIPTAGTATPRPSPGPSPTAHHGSPGLTPQAWLPVGARNAPLMSPGGVDGAPRGSMSAPATPNPPSPWQPDAVSADNPRLFTLAMNRGILTINGRTFEMDAVAEDEIVKLGTSEVWEIFNDMAGGIGPGPMTMQMAHPFHVHNVQFRIIERIPPDGAAARANWESVEAGYVDDGWHDVVMVMPGERVRIEIRFEDYTGRYLYHCHNLEHEDQGMMRNYEVRA